MIEELRRERERVNEDAATVREQALADQPPVDATPLADGHDTRCECIDESPLVQSLLPERWR